MRMAAPLYWSLVIFGLALSLWMALHSQVMPDQVNQLRLGWHVLEEGEWLPYGVPTSAGGKTPGGSIAIVTAIPLVLWSDYRAVALSIALLGLGAFLVLERAIRPALGPVGRWLVLLMLWLSPWRMAYASHIWAPNYALPIGMMHLATAIAMRTRRSFWATLTHVLLIGLGAQIHLGVALLGLFSLLLYTGRLITVHWGGFAAASAVVVASLVPWLQAAAADPSLLPGGWGFPFRGLVLIAPLLRGFLYVLRTGSLSLPGRLLHFDFTAGFGADVDQWLAPFATAVCLAAHATVLVACWALWRLVRWGRGARPWRDRVPGQLRPWLRSYLLVGWIASIATFAASPTTIMHWQTLAVLHVAVLTTALPLESWLRLRRRRPRRLILLWTALTVCLLFFLAFGSPKYRRGGREAAVATLTADHPLVDRYRLREHATVVIDPDHEWISHDRPPPRNNQR